MMMEGDNDEISASRSARTLPPRIRSLPKDTAIRVVATSIIQDLQTAVIGLLKNSLDADADRVTITINLARSSIEIQDNGHGIPAQEFAANGGLCKAHHTSKQAASRALKASSSDGVFLSSLASISLLEIVSRTSDSQQPGCSITIHQGHIIGRHLHSNERQVIRTQDAGTTVTVKDLFGNVPVRLKQRLLASNLQRYDEAIWQDVKRQVVAILLAWWKPCIVRLRDELNPQRNVTLTPSHPATSHALTSSALKDGTTSYTIKHKLVFLSQAKLCANISQKDWIALSASTSSSKVKGFVCVYPSPNKSCQFITFGNHPVLRSNEAGVLYDIVNKTFAKSSFGDDGHSTRLKGSELPPTDDSRGKSVDRHPMFILGIDLPADRERHLEAISEKDLANRITPLITKTVEKWLIAHGHYIVKTASRTASLQRPGRTSMQHSRPHDHDHSGQSDSEAAQSEHDGGTSKVIGNASLYSHHIDQADTRPWSRIKRSREATSCNEDESRSTTDGVSTSWPTAKNAMALRTTSATRLGKEHPRSELSRALSDAPSPQDIERSVPDRDNHDQRISPEGPMLDTRSRNHDLPETLRAWEAPLLAAPTEPAIPRSNLALNEVGLDQHNFLSIGRRGAADGTADVHKLSRADLVSTVVIDQVDSKFILCRTLRKDSELLFVIDQHAASERIILESLLHDAFLPQSNTAEHAGMPSHHLDILTKTTALDKPIVFETTKHEFDAFTDRRADFSVWGISYDVSLRREALGSSQVQHSDVGHRVVVTALPSVIVERCRLAPRILIDLLRSEVWEMSVPPAYTKHKTSSSTEQPAWLSKISRCPKRILDMINSRACRSAIMFNDVLTREQCTELVQQLSKTVFPFMCAHGRTSVVPLYELRAGEDLYQGLDKVQLLLGQPHERSTLDVRTASNFSASFTAWRQRERFDS